MFAERLFPAARRNVWRGLRAATRFQPARGRARMCVKAVRVCARLRKRLSVVGRHKIHTALLNERYAGLGRPNAPRQVDT